MKINTDSRVTYINKATSEFWEKWKKYNECTKEEKEKINLASYPSDCILFDRDLPTTDEKIITEDYEKFKNLLLKKKIDFFTSWRSPHGYHILVPFDNLNNFSNDLKREVKALYIEIFKCDPAKISDKGVVSLPNRPHFKDGKIYKKIEEIEGVNKINDNLLEFAKKELHRKKEQLSKLNLDKDFKDYFKKDKFWLILNSIDWEKMPMSCGFNNIISKNLAIAAAKTGLSRGEIDKILKVFIEKIKGYNYIEFEGWLHKALDQELTDYNPYELNTWTKNYTNNEVPYDLTPIPVDELIIEKEKRKERMNLIWNDDIKSMTNKDTEWVVDKWIPKGDICFIAGKSGTFKTTFMIHIGLAIANDKLVFNKYTVIPSKVLYINEEMNKQTFKDFYNRITKGMQLKNVTSFALSQEEGLKLDLIKQDIDTLTDIEHLANVILNKKFDVVIFDSFRRFFTGDENDATKMNYLFSKLKKLRKLCNDVTIIVVHHLKKFPFNTSFDIKDMLRGSSDIVNSADSIIGADRKTGHDSFTVMHIKNRSGPEMKKKLILVNTGEKGDEVYLHESEADIEETKSSGEKCAEDIFQIIETERLKVFTRKEIADKLENKYKSTVIFLGFKELESQGLITSSGKGKSTKWVWNEEVEEKTKMTEQQKTLK